MNRKEKRAARIVLLAKQTRIFEAGCKKCAGLETHSVKQCQECPFFKEMTAIGKGLSKITGESQKGFKQTVERIPHNFALTVEKYGALVVQGLSDREIAKQFNVTQPQIKNWKARHNVRKSDFLEGPNDLYALYLNDELIKQADKRVLVAEYGDSIRFHSRPRKTIDKNTYYAIKIESAVLTC